MWTEAVGGQREGTERRVPERDSWGTPLEKMMQKKEAGGRKGKTCQFHSFAKIRLVPQVHPAL